MQRTEQILREMLAEAQKAEQAESLPVPTRLQRMRSLGRHWRRSRSPATGTIESDDALKQLFAPRASGGGNGPALPRVVAKRDKDSRRSDLVMAALGVTLGLTCALFPWYIFFNQEQFGVQGIRFGGKGTNSGRSAPGSGPGSDAPSPVAATVPDGLDPFATGALQDAPMSPAEAPGPDKQPFPADAAAFRLVHIANGRAMIEDQAGLWVVQTGSRLPDSSRVVSIEQRKGKWVLVTSKDRVLEIAR